MLKVWLVALRDFKATVLTKAFLIGALIFPIIALISIAGIALLSSQKPPAVKGTVAIIDRTGALSATGEPLVAGAVEQRLTPEAIAKRYESEKEAAAEAAKSAAGKVLGEEAMKSMPSVDKAIKAIDFDLPALTPERLPPGADPLVEREPIRAGDVFGGGRIALVVVGPEALTRLDGKEEYGGFEVIVAEKLDARVQDLLRDQIGDAVLDARIRHAGHSPVDIRSLARLKNVTMTALTPDGERKSNPAAQFIIPMAFMILTWIAVFSGGQTLLTTTIEEKSNRVMEVLLSAVSPTQLMAGKIIGQLMVGLVVLLMYSGMGMIALVAMARSDLISWAQLAWLIVFFLIAYFLIASIMASVGSAVSDLQEANTLLGPVMMVIMLPMILMIPIMQNPKSLFAVITSFVPPIHPFVMLLRISSTDPPPLWQVILSVVIGIIASVIAVRIAAKIFRIGVLMYGKPPNFATLVRWVRMA